MVTGIILAGGQSSRMGTDKALLEFNGKKLIEYSIDVLTKVTDEVIVIGNTRTYDFPGLKTYKDLRYGYGPLGGIYTGLFYSNSASNLILGCDTPFVNADLLKYLLTQSNSYEAVMPLHKKRYEPLCAYYSKNCSERLKTLMIGGYKTLKNIIPFFNTKTIIIDSALPFYKANLFYNINTKADLFLAEGGFYK